MDSESEPKIDVSARVIQRIRQKRPSVIDPRLSLVSVCACALSALAIVVMWTASSRSDSLASLADSAAMHTGPERCCECSSHDDLPRE